MHTQRVETTVQAWGVGSSHHQDQGRKYWCMCLF